MRKFVLLLMTIYLNLQGYLIDAQQRKVVCYWNSNSGKHVGLPGEFNASAIDPTICTHIIYHHIWILSGNIHGWSTEEEFFNLKERNPNVKLLVGIGGPNWGSIIPSGLVGDATNRAKLATDIKGFLDQNPDLDGCDFDWQWPGQRDEASKNGTSDRENFPLFLLTLRDKLSSKIISISVAPRNEDIQTSYDIPAIIPHVDFINLNSFDLRGTNNDTETAFHSPYRKDPNDLRPEASWNAESIVDNWLGKNVPPEKLTLGIATYGRSFTLSDSANFGVGAAVSGIGRISSFLNAQQIRPERINYIPYAEICSKINDGNSNWETFWSSEHFAPYAVFDEDQWVGYDDENSTMAKIHLVLDKNLGGVNYAYVDFDDFTGSCGSPFQLIRTGYDVLIGGILPPNPVDPTTTTRKPGDITSSSTTTEEITSSSSTTEEITSSSSTTEEITSSSSTTEEITSSSSTTEEITSSSSTEETTESSQSTTSEESTTIQDTTTVPEETLSDTSTQSRTSTQKTTKTTRESTSRQTGTTDFKTPPITILSTSQRNNEYSTTINPSRESTTIQLTDSTISRTSSMTTDFRTPPVTPQEKPNNGDEHFGSSINQKNIQCISAYGNQKHPDNCTKFIICAHSIPYVFDCEDGFYYDEIEDRCDYQSNVLCHEES